MNIYQFLKGLRERFILTLLIIAFGSGSLYAEHLFSVNYDDLSQDNANLIRTEVARFDALASTMSMTRNRNNKEVYSFSLSSVQNTKIVILNEETGNSVIITPVEGAPAQFELSPFFIEELKQAALGNADQYLVVETGTDFSVRNAASVSTASQEVFIPRYFYGPKENVKEALPEDRQIIHIFKEKPRLIPAFPDDPENLRYVANLEEEMSYYVYMYKLPDSTLCIYDEHFNPSAGKNGVSTNTNTRTSTRTCCTNLQFDLSGSLSTQQQTATEYALELWSKQLTGTQPVSINTSFVPMAVGILGGSYTQPSYLNVANQTWYCSALGNQLAGYNVVPGMDDIRIEMNSYYSSSFYYGLDGNAGSLTDWVTVMLHEVTHGLGFYSNCTQDGRYYYVASDGIGYYDNSNRPGIFDRQLYQGTTGNTCLTDLTQSQREALFTSGNLYAGSPGSHLLAANGGTRVKMYAPNPWQSGSSVSHWDNNPGFTNFMQYAYQYPLHTFNARKIAIMRDMGWEIPCPSGVTPTFSSVQTVYCSGSSIPPLPTTSDQGITGSWSPAINNTTTTTYTFTPTAGQCATSQTLTITISAGNNIINFVGQNVTTNQTVTNPCGDINVQNVNVTSGAKLTLDATGTTTINSDFEVVLGSELEIK